MENPDGKPVEMPEKPPRTYAVTCTLCGAHHPPELRLPSAPVVTFDVGPSECPACVGIFTRHPELASWVVDVLAKQFGTIELATRPSGGEEIRP